MEIVLHSASAVHKCRQCR